MSATGPTSSPADSPAEGVHLGLDIGGTKVLGVAVGPAGEVLADVRLASEPGPERVVAVAAEAVRALADALGTPLDTLAGIGVGVPGVVDARRGVLTHAVNLGVDGEGLALADRLRERTGLPVAVENDVNAAAVGAARVLGLDGTDLAYLSIGTGLAAGLVLGGRLHRGTRGGAGEIGHLPVDPLGPVCPCGQRGCLEALVSGSAIARAWPVEPEALAPGEGPSHALFRAAAAGDEKAGQVRDRVADHLAAAVQLLVLTVDVDVVVLGGGVAEVGERLRLAVASALSRRARASAFLASLDLPARVTTVPQGRPVAAVGAALLAPGREAR
ncbi:ROK family protein [Kineosporia sp. A_224]|uniref:ROK family protein n=1 Tax=Kineosporia sp. A_224 TaxID=1962180 RepID=UPI000B4B1F54|nr:ROK family protein [Kineosporia sp. A_224]